MITAFFVIYLFLFLLLFLRGEHASRSPYKKLLTLVIFPGTVVTKSSSRFHFRLSIAKDFLMLRLAHRSRGVLAYASVGSLHG